MESGTGLWVLRFDEFSWRINSSSGRVEIVLLFIKTDFLKVFSVKADGDSALSARGVTVCWEFNSSRWEMSNLPGGTFQSSARSENTQPRNRSIGTFLIVNWLHMHRTVVGKWWTSNTSKTMYCVNSFTPKRIHYLNMLCIMPNN